MIHWWEKPDQDSRWDPKAYGDRVPEAGPCPYCGGVIVYNGNYFCEHWEEDTCKWALSHPAADPREREICDLLGIDYE